MSGVLTVARLELKVRVRAGRWRWLLAGWFVVLVGFTVLLRLALFRAQNLDGNVGTVMYGGLQLFLLALALLVMPALTAQSVNGDRERGTLGVLQVTRLSAFDIAGGKLVAAWGTACIFLLASAPLVVWSMVEKGVPALRVLIVTLVVALLLGVICAVSLGFSALLARGTTSSVLSYLSVFALTLGTLIVFGLATVATTQTAPREFLQRRPFGSPGVLYLRTDRDADRPDMVDPRPQPVRGARRRRTRGRRSSAHLPHVPYGRNQPHPLHAAGPERCGSSR